MDISLLYHPNRQEEVTVDWDLNSYDDLDYYQWVELMEFVEDGRIVYSTWYQGDETDWELMVLTHGYTIKDGQVLDYVQELTE